MADGKEEREERKARLEAAKKAAQQREGWDEEPTYEGQPERGDS